MADAVVIATWQDVIISNPISFLIGLIVGFVLSSRYRIVKIERNGDRKK
jgi:uncharacterized protein YneF (UPF0154 family)